MKVQENWSRAVGGGDTQKPSCSTAYTPRRAVCPGVPTAVMSRAGSQPPTARSASHCKKPETLSAVKLALAETVAAF